MPPVLSAQEQRVLGCLLEKEKTTLEAYPLTLNSLRLACNQKTSREPVMELSETEVTTALYTLKGKNLVGARTDARATKYVHKIEMAAALNSAQSAVITLLLLRGPQTSGELRGRSERLHSFETPAEVEEALSSLAAYADGPWVKRLERAKGEKEQRWTHLLGGDVSEVEVLEAIAQDEMGTLKTRVEDLESEVAALRHTVKGLEEMVQKMRPHLDEKA